MCKKENLGQVYLVQPQEFEDTDIFKVGMSAENNLKRVKNYKSKTIILNIFICKNPKKLENKILKIFKENFKLYRGQEYFEGDINEMCKIFSICISNYDDEDITANINEDITKDITEDITKSILVVKRSISTHSDIAAFLDDIEYNGGFKLCGNKSGITIHVNRNLKGLEWSCDLSATIK